MHRLPRTCPPGDGYEDLVIADLRRSLVSSSTSSSSSRSSDGARTPAQQGNGGEVEEEEEEEGELARSHCGLFPHFSLLNHSCLPNCVHFCVPNARAGSTMVGGRTAPCTALR